MAFQMIPPRLSSSPPPLDSLPPVACPGDDDEFDHFSSHNASFDITGKRSQTGDASYGLLWEGFKYNDLLIIVQNVISLVKLEFRNLR